MEAQPNFISVSSQSLWLQENPDLAYLFLFHRNGYLRMQALQLIGKAPPSSLFLAAVLIRLNDWVPQIRHAAVDCLDKIRPNIESGVVLETAEYIFESLDSWQRIERDGKRAAEALLQDSEFRSSLTQRFLSNAPGQLARQLGFMIKNPYMDKDLINLAHNSKNASVRRLAYKSLLKASAEWFVGYDVKWIDKVYNISKRIPKYEMRSLTVSYDKEPLILHGLKDKAAIVRRCVADEFLIDREEVINIEPCLSLLLEDKNKSVRERGEWLVRHMAKHGQPN